MRHRKRFLPILLACAAFTAQARDLHALPPVTVTPTAGSSEAQRAAALRDDGNRAMLEMRYVDALASYRQAAALAPEYLGVLYSIARAHQLLGEFADALTVLEQFDGQASPEAKAKVGQLDKLFAELRSRVGTLQLSCNVPGARVLLREKVIGTTPLRATRLEAGAATLELELEGFFPLRRDVVVPAGGSLSLELELHARSNSGLLIVHTTPTGAQISIDGRRQGTSSPSVEIALPPGTHRITARREGYDEASVPLVLKAGATRTLGLQLQRSVPITSRWWFWTGATAVVAGGVALAIVSTTERSAEKGSLAPGQISAPLHF